MLVNAAVYKDGHKIQNHDLFSLKERGMQEKEIVWAAFKDPNREDLSIFLTNLVSMN